MEDMRCDVELLNAMLNESPHVHDVHTDRWVCLSAKQLADWTNRSLQTISDYRTGKTNIPIEFWRAVFNRTCDLRVVALLVPIDLYNVEINPRQERGPESPGAFFREALVAESEYHEQAKALCEILADGKIDDLDARRVTAYDDAYWRHRVRDASLHRAVLRRYSDYAGRLGVS